MQQHFKKKWVFSLVLFYSILTLPISEHFALCYYLSLIEKQTIFNYFLLLQCCFWIQISPLFNKALHNAFFTEESSLENPFQKHQRWSSLLISSGHVKKRKKRCLEKETKNSAGKIHEKQLKEGPWDNGVVISIQHLFLNQLSHFFSMINSSFQRSSPTPPSVSTQQPNFMCLLYSTFSRSIFSPYFLCTASYFPCLFKCVMILMLLGLAAWKKERTRHDLPQVFLQHWDCVLGLREWAMHKTKKKIYSMI